MRYLLASAQICGLNTALLTDCKSSCSQREHDRPGMCNRKNPGMAAFPQALQNILWQTCLLSYFTYRYNGSSEKCWAHRSLLLCGPQRLSRLSRWISTTPTGAKRISGSSQSEKVLGAPSVLFDLQTQQASGISASSLMACNSAPKSMEVVKTCKDHQPIPFLRYKA